MRLSGILALAVMVAIISALLAKSQEVTGLQQKQEEIGKDGGHMNMLMSPLRWTWDLARGLQNRASSGTSEAGSSSLEQLDNFRKQTFNMFARIYNKTYSPSEYRRRMQLFFERRKEIEASVRAYAEGKLPFMMRENEFTDWDAHELKALTGVAPPKSSAELLPEERDLLVNIKRRRPLRLRRSTGNETKLALGNQEKWSELEDLDNKLMVKATENLPASKDWRSSDCVAPPLNQMKCGCCYAIATVSVIETMRCLHRGQRGQSSPLLSSQQVIDCSTSYQNSGCDGGWPTRVLRYLQDTRLLARESCYPFVRRQLSCRLRQVAATQSCTVSASPTETRLSYKILNNENDILMHVARTGPVVTVMRATDRFLYYGGGIFDDRKCSRRRDDVDHAIVIVGYGRENGLDYWLIKNSWGTSQWGLQGYGKYRRGTNACSIGHWGWVITS